MQILEIYNEKVRDLLDDKDTGKSPEIHVHPRIGVYVDGAVDAQVEAVDQVQKLLDSGLSRASVAATARNARSSRGHVVFRLVIERHEEDHTVVTSELFCVDLAGRENEKTTKVTGQNFTELTFINRSLMWLAQCIQALGKQAQARRRSSSVGSEVEGSNRARFRNSKLTLLLINALTGNSKTCLLATVSPALVNLDESLVTLNFASTVKTIKVAARRAERRDTVKLVQSLSEELASLREQLSGSPRNASDLQAQVGTLQNMMESYKTRWEEAEHNAELLRKETPRVLSRERGNSGPNYMYTYMYIYIYFFFHTYIYVYRLRDSIGYLIPSFPTKNQPGEGGRLAKSRRVQVEVCPGDPEEWV